MGVGVCSGRSNLVVLGFRHQQLMPVILRCDLLSLRGHLDVVKGEQWIVQTRGLTCMQLDSLVPRPAERRSGHETSSWMPSYSRNVVHCSSCSHCGYVCLSVCLSVCRQPCDPFGSPLGALLWRLQHPACAGHPRPSPGPSGLAGGEEGRRLSSRLSLGCPTRDHEAGRRPCQWLHPSLLHR